MSNKSFKRRLTAEKQKESAVTEIDESEDENLLDVENADEGDSSASENEIEGSDIESPVDSDDYDEESDDNENDEEGNVSVDDEEDTSEDESEDVSNAEDNEEGVSDNEDEDEEDISSEEEASLKESSSHKVNNSKSIKKSKKNTDSTEASAVSLKELKNKQNEVHNGDTVKKIKVKNNKESKSSQQIGEYDDHDTSDEEDIRNTIGNVPMNWYDEYGHLGYDWDGNKILKGEKQDQLDMFLQRIEDPEFWRTVKDPQTGKDVVLNDEEVGLIRKIQGQNIPDETFDAYAPWIEWFTSEVMKTPLRKFPEHKRCFLPSREEAKKVSKLVHALKMGWIKTKEEQDKLRAKKEPQFYMLWQTDDQTDEMRRIHKHIPAPKRHLPGHAESYNPPHEYLFDERELKQWNKQKDTPLKRKLHYVPQKYNCLRNVPAYSRYIKERFLRCLDLYLCPRAIKMKLTIEPEALVPKLPSPRELQPFPTFLAIEYEGHSDMVRSIDTDKTGQYLVSGSDDCTVKIWEINTGRCLKTIQTEAIVRSVEWCPNSALSLILIASGNRVILLNPHVGDFLICNKTDTLLKDPPPTSEIIISERVRTTVEWKEPTEDEYAKGYRAILVHFKEVTQVTWHGRGDYFASVMPDGQNRSVLIGQVSKRRSQLPFSKPKGLVQRVIFHPSKPFLFVATQRHVRIYDLMKQMLIKKLLTNSKWISTMDIHPGGDNLLVATYDRKVLWFDLDLSTKPYQTLRLHGTAVRGVSYHKRYPLFASGSDDRSLIISHGMVYNDLMQNPLIVPLKRLQDHKSANDFGIFDVHFHPLQPWVFTAGADGTIKLYSN